ncbi:MAG: DUF1573 domain-containing protein, partial [Planctomycetota bacterium]
GKKIRFRDGIAAVATLWECRTSRMSDADWDASPACEDKAGGSGAAGVTVDNCARACRVIVSLLLFVTAILKFHAVVVDHVGIHFGLFPPWISLASAVVECAIAIQLTRKRFRAVSTVAGLTCFVVFLAVGGVVWLGGFGSCGCLGVISSSAFVTSMISASAIAILWFTRPMPFVPCVAKEWSALARERPLHWPVMAMLSLVLVTGLLGTATGRQYLGLPSFQTIVAEPIELPTVRAGNWIVGEVRITNQSDVRCKIIGQKASCNCILVGTLPDSIPPGETVSVPVKIKAADIAGRLEKVIVIYLRHPSQFTVSCFVRGRVVAAL